MMTTRWILAGVSLALLGSLVAQGAKADEVRADPSLMCFGNEPSWSIALVEPGKAQLTLLDQPSVEFRGASSRIEPLRERIWRGQAAAGSAGELVVFLREEECSDGMSDALARPSAVTSSTAKLVYTRFTTPAAVSG